MIGPKSDKDWQASCDMRTLREAEEIKKSAARHAAARKAAAQEMKSLEKVVAPAKKPTMKRGK